MLFYEDYCNLFKTSVLGFSAPFLSERKRTCLVEAVHVSLHSLQWFVRLCYQSVLTRTSDRLSLEELDFRADGC